MKEIEASIIILTLNPGTTFRKVVDMVFSQKFVNFEVIIIDSTSDDNSLEYAKEYPIRLVKIPRIEFGHGRTRNLGAKLARGNYVVYLTQDAIPKHRYWLQNLIRGLKDSCVAGVFGRQIPKEGSNQIINYGYNQDYPNIRRIIDITNYYKYSVVYSDVNSAVRKDMILNNPYPEDVIVSEDLGWALSMLDREYSILYEPEAAVIHSHSFNLCRIARVGFDQGVSFSQIYRMNIPNNSNRKDINRIAKKYLFFMQKLKVKFLFVLLIVDTIKCVSISLGKRYRQLPLPVCKFLSNQKSYWEKKNK
ncbi:glycosyltransferase family 2 protein [candidate division WWE3 bacterium]|jgi:rhamnosyltransferase|uniref:Glycosyltransferase family 2 protein n=1 Tax=candidate division WWE3 bacterium TaxID=2053526 RepID=A0A3A4ZNH9_UNCKA|nr:MAG: glycosyltransferase family 2 protein [candidate division WWE3 bacterium]